MNSLNTVLDRIKYCSRSTRFRRSRSK